jgi:hypothetical protein
MADEWAEFNPTAAPTGGGDEWAEFKPTTRPPGEDVTAGMALRGIPVLGAYIPQAEAAIRAAAHPLTGVGEKGGTFSERYAANLPKRQADYAQAEREQPIASTALQVGGGMAALAPLGATALGARALGGVGTIPQRIIAGGASGAGISAADALARGEDPTTAAEVGGGLGMAIPVIGAAAGRIGRTARGYLGAPNADELGQAVDAGYTALRASGAEYNPTAINRGIAGIKASQDIDEELTPRVWRLLNRTQAETTPPQAGAMSPLTGMRPTARPGQTFDELDTLRRQLGKVARDYTNPTEALAARQAIRGIDDIIGDPANIMRGNAQQVATLAAETRANAAAEFRVRAMDALRQRVEDRAASAHSGMNVENTYRQELKSFIRPNNKGVSSASKEGFTRQEIHQIRQALRTSSFPNMLRLVSNALGGGGGIATGGLGLTAYATGDPRFALAAGAGLGGRTLSNAMMRNRGNMLNRMAAARSPLAGQMGAAGPLGAPRTFPAAQGAALGGATSLMDLLDDQRRQ